MLSVKLFENTLSAAANIRAKGYRRSSLKISQE